MSRYIVLFISLFVMSFAQVVSAAADDIAWDKVIGADIKKLTTAEKTRVAQNLNRIKNTRGCTGTLAQCLKKGDQTARRHAGYVVRMIRKGKTDDFIDKGITIRKESTHTDEAFTIDVTTHPSMGNPQAKVVLVEFACFQCPFCAHLAPQLKKLKEKFGDKVVHYYKFFPVRSHKRGVPAALADLAAQRQGKFWQMYDLMYQNRSDLEDDDLLKYAANAGLDVSKFKADLKDSQLMRRVEKDKLEGMRYGVEGTPAFFVNGKLYQGSNDFEEIVDRVGEEIDILEGRIK